jgi:hypothetical protein
MSTANGELKVLKIDDFSVLQGLEIWEGRTKLIQFQSSQDILVPVNVNIIQRSNSVFKLVCIFNHSIELNLNFTISGDNTDCKIYNLVDLTDSQKVTLTQNISTAFANNQVEHITKCVLNQNSSVAIKHIAKAKSSTKNLKLNQKIQSLLLSPACRVQMQPILQIESEDVECKHGSTQGFLDAVALFYLQSRGLRLENAKQLLVEVFKMEVLG